MNHSSSPPQPILTLSKEVRTIVGLLHGYTGSCPTCSPENRIPTRLDPHRLLFQLSGRTTTPIEPAQQTRDMILNDIPENGKFDVVLETGDVIEEVAVVDRTHERDSEEASKRESNQIELSLEGKGWTESAPDIPKPNLWIDQESPRGEAEWRPAELYAYTDERDREYVTLGTIDRIDN